MADLILVVGSEKMNEGDSQATMTTVLEPFYQRFFIIWCPGDILHAVSGMVGKVWHP